MGGESGEGRVLGALASIDDPLEWHLDVLLLVHDKSLALGVVVNEIGEELDVGHDVVGEDVFEGMAREREGRVEEGEDLGSVREDGSSAKFGEGSEGRQSETYPSLLNAQFPGAKTV